MKNSDFAQSPPTRPPPYPICSPSPGGFVGAEPAPGRGARHGRGGRRGQHGEAAGHGEAGGVHPSQWADRTVAELGSLAQFEFGNYWK